jgi:hypothetical protein
MSLLFFRKLRESNSAHTCYAIHRRSPGPKQKIATLKVAGCGTHTVTPHLGRTITDAETRMMRAITL